MLVVLSAIFVFSRSTGDALSLYLSPTATAEDRAALSEQLGLDRPVLDQYRTFITKAVFHADFGESIRSRQPAMGYVIDRLPATLRLGAAAAILALVTGITFGVLAAKFEGSAIDILARTLAVVGQSLPNFVIGIGLLWIFAVGLGWLPAGGDDGLKSLILPAVSLASFEMAGLTRLMRSSMLECLESDYVRLARAKGLTETRVIGLHSLRNALPRIAPYAGLMTAGMLGGSIIIETIYTWPGVGQLLIQAVYARDFPIVAAVVFFYTVVYIVVNLLVDVAVTMTSTSKVDVSWL